MLNDFVATEEIDSVIEFGCGDGEQLALGRYPRYLGMDVSPSTLQRTAQRFSDDRTKSFLRYDPACFADPAGFLSAQLTLSLDVVYHLVEDGIYARHLQDLFGASRRFVILYTSDSERLSVPEHPTAHVRHRPVRRDVAARFPHWTLRSQVDGPQRLGGSSSFAEFLIYQHHPDSARNRAEVVT